MRARETHRRQRSLRNGNEMVAAEAAIAAIERKSHPDGCRDGGGATTYVHVYVSPHEWRKERRMHYLTRYTCTAPLRHGAGACDAGRRDATASGMPKKNPCRRSPFFEIFLSFFVHFDGFCWHFALPRDPEHDCGNDKSATFQRRDLTMLYNGDACTANWIFDNSVFFLDTIEVNVCIRLPREISSKHCRTII